jgi:hypothetical protein
MAEFGEQAVLDWLCSVSGLTYDQEMVAARRMAEDEYEGTKQGESGRGFSGFVRRSPAGSLEPPGPLLTHQVQRSSTASKSCIMGVFLLS